MIRIAICDDEAEACESIDAMALEYFRKADVMFQQAVFQDAEKLLYEVEDGAHFDLFLLDIEMPQMNGMKLTEKLKAVLPDALIIFISSHDKYVYSAFRVQPFRFIPKAQLEDMLPLALKDALRLIQSMEGEFVVVENKRTLEKIPIKRIAYIWHREKYAYIEKTDGKSTKVRKTLRKLYEELPPGEFEWADRGRIVSLQQIECIEGTEVLLKNGVRLSAGLDRLTELKRRIKNYWLEEDWK